MEEGNVVGFHCAQCWRTVEALVETRFGMVCQECWANGDADGRWGTKPLDWIRSRQLDANPRCPACKSSAFVAGDHQPPPMFHAAHPYAPCEVLVDGERCGCRHGLDAA